MKAITKKLMSIGLASIMAGAVMGMAGCSTPSTSSTPSSETSGSKDETTQSSTPYSMKFIKIGIYLVHYENGAATLHKGDLAVYTSMETSKGYGLTPVLKLNCGKTIPTYLYNPYDKMPDESKYDHICEECFEIEKD